MYYTVVMDTDTVGLILKPLKSEASGLLPRITVHPIIEGLFLERFVDEKVQWMHIDMAVPVRNDKNKSATGFAVATLVEWVFLRLVMTWQKRYAASEITGEKLRRMPMEESYWESMKSRVADMMNLDLHSITTQATA
ncbi:unnamed protein product [Fraxinus pennsylvanica]|uniref:Cytosol aminopeptidase domain-containing protein n=1 Tax=Fraxinus pennsylvanica TaxID=56036 RepID=A0AAD2A8A0_9LAMI|nr:unnamed protein product [Fraxinus pennsylvanica]